MIIIYLKLYKCMQINYYYQIEMITWNYLIISSGCFMAYKSLFI